MLISGTLRSVNLFQLKTMFVGSSPVKAPIKKNNNNKKCNLNGIKLYRYTAGIYKLMQELNGDIYYSLFSNKIRNLQLTFENNELNLTDLAGFKCTLFW